MLSLYKFKYKKDWRGTESNPGPRGNDPTTPATKKNLKRNFNLIIVGEKISF